jgi:hypothetical protein
MLLTVPLLLPLLEHQDLVRRNGCFIVVGVSPPKVRVPHRERVGFPNLCAPLIADPSHDNISAIFVPSDHHLPVQQLILQTARVGLHPHEIVRAAKNLNKISVGHDLNFQLTLIRSASFCTPLVGTDTSCTPALIWAGIKPAFFT